MFFFFLSPRLHYFVFLLFSYFIHFWMHIKIQSCINSLKVGLPHKDTLLRNTVYESQPSELEQNKSGRLSYVWKVHGKWA